ncbi:MAG: hemolysin III family protein [Pseudomonadota bacterium]
MEHAGEAKAAEVFPAYTDRERLADAVVHIAGLALAMLSVPVLITLSVFLDGRGPTIAAVAIYSACLLAMLGVSAAYNMLAGARDTVRGMLRRFDTAVIFLKIAGTQTPFAVLAGGAAAAWVLPAIWVAAFLGAAMRLVYPRRFEKVSIAFYLLLGWAGVLIIGGGEEPLALATLILLIVGGLLYSVGVVFHLWNSLPYQNAIWHGFVLAATFVFYAAVIVELGLRVAG